MKPQDEPRKCGNCHARPPRSPDAVLCDVCRAAYERLIGQEQNPPGTGGTSRRAAG